MKIIITGILSIVSVPIFAQIMSDTSIQVVGYWDILDKKTYQVSYEKYSVANSDTSSRQITKYDIDIIITDSTEHSYTIEWIYRNYEMEPMSEIVAKAVAVAEDIPIILVTDEFGTIVEVLNWEQVRDQVLKVTEALKQEYQEQADIQKMIDQIMTIYTTKEGIESNVIKDALQFYTFHGGAYDLNEEVEGQLQVPNNVGDLPFDAEVTISLDEINIEDDNFVLRAYQKVDSKQLLDATYQFLSNLDAIKDSLPPKNEIGEISNETWTASRIDGSTGWIIYSVESKEIKVMETTRVEERIIEIK